MYLVPMVLRGHALAREDVLWEVKVLFRLILVIFRELFTG
jgi:hypothetical protein